MRHDEDDCEMIHCAQCGGHLSPLGTLGRLHWFRCSACGAEQSVDAVCVDNVPFSNMTTTDGTDEPHASELGDEPSFALVGEEDENYG